MLDFKKPVRTKSGITVRILSTSVNSPSYSVVGLTVDKHGTEAVETWCSNGQYLNKGPSGMDLINCEETADAA